MFRKFTARIRKSRLRLLVVAAATAALVAPAAAWAGHQFQDVPVSNIFHDDIAWMADNGVTAGCNPPVNDEYCPDELVTREQMAAFMRRLDSKDVFTTFEETESIVASETSGPIDADTLDGKDSTDFAPAPDPVETRTCGVGDITIAKAPADADINSVSGGGGRWRQALSSTESTTLSCAVSLEAGEELRSVTAFLYDSTPSDNATACVVGSQEFPGDSGQWGFESAPDTSEGSYTLLVEPGGASDVVGPVSAPAVVTLSCGFDMTSGSPSLGLQGATFEVATG